jgi:multiple RNA-binding domain-containing protein 1
MQVHFDAAVSAAGGSIRSARVAKRKGPDGKQLSAGYGFVECSSEDAAKIVMKKMQVCTPSQPHSVFCSQS